MNVTSLVLACLSTVAMGAMQEPPVIVIRPSSWELHLDARDRAGIDRALDRYHLAGEVRIETSTGTPIRTVEELQRMALDRGVERVTIVERKAGGDDLFGVETSLVVGTSVEESSAFAVLARPILRDRERVRVLVSQGVRWGDVAAMEEVLREVGIRTAEFRMLDP